MFQRPQHLLSRAARMMRVVFWGEAVAGEVSGLDKETAAEGVEVVGPRIPDGAAPVAVVRPRIPDGTDPVAAERALLDAAAALRPGMQFVMVGPIVKIGPASLPWRPNIHHAGRTCYDELPNLLAHWDVALTPFALDEATRYISPTRTPEYLAAVRPVVSTPITDVVQQYGGTAGVQTAEDPASFAAVIDRALAPGDWQPEADRLLADMSWDSIWAHMHAMIAEAALAGPVTT